MRRPRNLVHCLQARADAWRQRPALGRGPGLSPVSWTDYAAWAHRFAVGLARLGLPRGSTVALYCGPGPSTAMATLGALEAGALVAPLLTEWCDADLRAALARAAPWAVVAESAAGLRRLQRACPDLLDRTPRIVLQEAGTVPVPAVGLSELLAPGASDAAIALPGELEAESPAVLVFSAGTLGEPRPVSLSHRQILAAAESFGSLAELRPDDVLLSLLPCGHPAEVLLRLGVAPLFGCCLERAPGELAWKGLAGASATVVLASPAALEDLGRALSRAFAQVEPSYPQVARWAQRQVLEARLPGARAVPPAAQLKSRFAELLVQQPVRQALGLGSVRALYCVGGGLAPSRFESLTAAGLPVFTTWGTAESCGILGAASPEWMLPGTAGRALPKVALRIGEEGRIAASAPWLDPALAEDTGDQGALDSDGMLTLAGRSREIFYTAAGRRIAPRTVELELRRAPLVGEAVVFGEGRSGLGALIALDGEASASFAARLGIAADPAVLAAHPALHAELARQLSAVATERDLPEVALFEVVPEGFKVERGERTPLGEPRRSAIASRHGEAIERLFPGKKGAKAPRPKPPRPAKTRRSSGRRGTRPAH